MEKWYGVSEQFTNLIMDYLAEFYDWGDVLTAGKYAQVTNNPENDGCINAVLLV